ncbi:MAG: hypothetical protein IPJ30_12600 [Acidobacteria bacterium]|nr:hypothetical protein [Acidobacteriota bacterium]
MRAFYKYDPKTAGLDLETVSDRIGFRDGEYNWKLVLECDSLAELNDRLGFPNDAGSYEASWNVWLLKDAKIGDIVFIGRGFNRCLGISVIEGPLEHDPDGPVNFFRRVKWITDDTYQYTSDSYLDYKSLFRPDFFAPTKVGNFLISEYAKNPPELTEVFDEYGLDYSYRPEDAPESRSAASDAIAFSEESRSFGG